MSSETRTLFSHLISMQLLKCGEPVATYYSHIMAVRSMPISDGTSLSQLFRLERSGIDKHYELECHSNLLGVLSGASCSSSDKLGTEHKKRENTFEDLQV